MMADYTFTIMDLRSYGAGVDKQAVKEQSFLGEFGPESWTFLAYSKKFADSDGGFTTQNNRSVFVCFPFSLATTRWLSLLFAGLEAGHQHVNACCRQMGSINPNPGMDLASMLEESTAFLAGTP